MVNPLLELALDQLHGGVWYDFETFAGEYLAVEYPTLRTMASPNGDRGRDGEVFSVDGEPGVGAQYSVSKDWSSKITKTLNRVREERLKYTHLIYATNQQIGASGDNIRAKARADYKVILDIRDRTWFLDRELTHAQRATASERLIDRYARPLLETRNVANRTGVALTRDDSRIALLHLALEDRDVDTDRSLTKSSFDALVLAALHGTNSGAAMSTAEIITNVRLRVPSGAPGQVDALVASSLTRLSRKGPVKMVKSSGYHLAFETEQEIERKTAEFLLEEAVLEQELQTVILDIVGKDRAAKIDLALVRASLDVVLLDRGEAFVSSVESGTPFQVDSSHIAMSLQKRKLAPELSLDELVATVLAILRSPHQEVRKHLGRLGDAYTLFSFLRQTPDVQKVLLEVFSDGDVWLDTSAVLPLLGEQLIDDAQGREYTILLNAARDAGLKLFVTEGVAEEIERHLNRSYAYASTNGFRWEGRPPFLFSAFVMSGRVGSAFAAWRSEISGKEHPEEDISDYLEEEFGIGTRSLLEYSDPAPKELRAAAQELWEEAHDRRRTDPSVRHRLVAHDVENSVGVIQLRRSTPRSPMGYRVWWLTLDKIALRMQSTLRDRMGKDAPDSPVLSPDFLAQLLRLGPIRKALEQDQLMHLPTATDMTLYDFASPNLLDEASVVRAEMHSDNERLLRRGVRDRMERRQREMGPQAVGGARKMEQRIMEALAKGGPSSIGVALDIEGDEFG